MKIDFWRVWRWRSDCYDPPAVPCEFFQFNAASSSSWLSSFSSIHCFPLLAFSFDLLSGLYAAYPRAYRPLSRWHSFVSAHTTSAMRERLVHQHISVAIISSFLVCWYISCVDGMGFFCSFSLEQAAECSAISMKLTRRTFRYPIRENVIKTLPAWHVVAAAIIVSSSASPSISLLNINIDSSIKAWWS